MWGRLGSSLSLELMQSCSFRLSRAGIARLTNAGDTDDASINVLWQFVASISGINQWKNAPEARRRRRGLCNCRTRPLTRVRTAEHLSTDTPGTTHVEMSKNLRSQAHLWYSCPCDTLNNGPRTAAPSDGVYATERERHTNLSANERSIATFLLPRI